MTEIWRTLLEQYHTLSPNGHLVVSGLIAATLLGVVIALLCFILMKSGH